MQQVYKQEIGTRYSLFNVLNIKACFTKEENAEQDDIRSLHGSFCNTIGFFRSHKGKETDQVNIRDRYNLFLLIKSMLSWQAMGVKLGEQRGENEKRKIQNVIYKRKTRHSFAGGAVIEASLKEKTPLSFYLKDTN